MKVLLIAFGLLFGNVVLAALPPYICQSNQIRDVIAAATSDLVGTGYIESVSKIPGGYRISTHDAFGGTQECYEDARLTFVPNSGECETYSIDLQKVVCK